MEGVVDSLTDDSSGTVVGVKLCNPFEETETVDCAVLQSNSDDTVIGSPTNFEDTLRFGGTSSTLEACTDDSLTASKIP